MKLLIVYCLSFVGFLVFVVFDTATKRLDFENNVNKIQQLDPLEGFSEMSEWSQFESERRIAQVRAEPPRFEEIAYLNNFPFLSDYVRALSEDKDPSLLLTKTTIVIGTINDEKSIGTSDRIQILNRIRSVRQKLIDYRDALRSLSDINTRLKAMEGRVEEHKRNRFQEFGQSLMRYFLKLETDFLLYFCALFFLSLLMGIGLVLSRKRIIKNFRKFQKLSADAFDLMRDHFQMKNLEDLDQIFEAEDLTEVRTSLKSAKKTVIKSGLNRWSCHLLDGSMVLIQREDLNLEKAIEEKVLNDVHRKYDRFLSQLDSPLARQGFIGDIPAATIEKLDQFLENIQHQIRLLSEQLKTSTLECADMKGTLSSTQVELNFFKEKAASTREELEKFQTLVSSERDQFGKLKDALQREKKDFARFKEDVAHAAIRCKLALESLRISDFRILYNRINAVILSLLSGNKDPKLLEDLASLNNDLMEALEANSLDAILAKIESLRSVDTAEAKRDDWITERKVDIEIST